MRLVALIGMLSLAVIGHAQEPLVWFTQADRLEYQADPEHWLWDLQGWLGKDEHKVWWKTEGRCRRRQRHRG